jgi:hypothetical protein
MIPILGELEPPPLGGFAMSDPLRDYLRLRPEHGQPVNFLAVLAGCKPVMDDWISPAHLGALRDLCATHGLTVVTDVQFQALRDQGAIDRIVGRDTLTTTRANGHRVGTPIGDASLHVFIGRDRSMVARTRAAGWYPLVIDGRATSKPWLDHVWFGRGLGYPACCLRAFAYNNNWAVNNMPYQAWRTTAGTPSALCNSLMRFSGLSWAAHLPCRYDCPATIELSARIRRVTYTHSAGLAAWIDRMSAAPYLVLNEWEAFAFTATDVGSRHIDYTGVTAAPSNRPNLRLYEALRGGSRLEIRDDLVLVLATDGTALHVERTTSDGFAPRVPFILNCSTTSLTPAAEAPTTSTASVGASPAQPSGTGRGSTPSG